MMRALWLLVLVALPAMSGEYVSYLGGRLGDGALAAATDASGNSYVAGATRSPDFPEAPGFTSSNPGTNAVAFVAKLSPEGRLLWRALIGSPDGDSAVRAIAVDSDGSLVVAGSTDVLSSGFVARLSPDGLTLMETIELNALPEAIAVDKSGGVYVAGSAGPGLPTTPGAYQPQFKPGDCTFQRHERPCTDAFAMKLSRDLSVVYSTYVGGSDEDTARAISVDSSGSAWVAGDTASADFPVSTQVGFGGRIVIGPHHFGDGFVARLRPDGSSLPFATFLGGPTEDTANAIVLDASGNVWVSGDLAASGAVKLDRDGSATYIHAVPRRPTDITAGPDGTIYVASGGLIRLNPTNGNVINRRSTLVDVLAVDDSGVAHIAGTAYKLVCVTTPGAMQPSYRGGDSDAFIGQVAGDRDGNVATCVTNAATFQPGFPYLFPLAGGVAPGEVVSIFGAFAPGTHVSFDGIAAPILYRGQAQINAVVPFEVEGPVTRVMIGGEGPLELPVIEAVPGIFVVLNEDYTVNSESNPARRGGRIILYATGAGRMHPPMPDGSVAGQALPLPRPLLGAAVRFGAIDATLEYAGAAPGLIAGVIQVNAKLPEFARNTRVMSFPANLYIGNYPSPPANIWVAP